MSESHFLIRSCHLISPVLDTQFRDSQMFNSAFTSLDRLINDFKAKLPLLAHFQLSAHPMTRTLAVTHALTDAATINLYNIFVDSDAGSKQRCLSAARGVVGVVRDGNLEEWTYINPIMGVSFQFFYPMIPRTSLSRCRPC